MEEAPRSRLLSMGRSIGPGLLAAAIALVVFAATIGHGFTLDDSYLLRSPLLSRPWDLRAVFTNGFYGGADKQLGLYRPLGDWALLLNAALAKAWTGTHASPAVFHSVNVLLHATASALLFAWLVSLPVSRKVAGAAAVLWAVLPVHVEVAANITSRYESLALVFGLGFLLALRRGHGLRGAALFLAALWSKESAVAFLPLAWLAGELFPPEPSPQAQRRSSLRSLLPSCAALALWFVLRSLVLSGEETATVYVENPVASASLGIRWMTAAKVQLLYLRDQLLPLWLSTDHSFRQLAPLRTALDPFVLGFLALIALAGAIAWRLRRKQPEIALCLAGYAILFSVASNFVLPIGTIMADRLAYAPSVFTCLLLALALSRLRPPALFPAAIAVLAIAFAYRSQAQSKVWKDDLTLCTEQVRTAPESAKSHGNLGDALRDLGRFAEAVVEYKKSLEIYPYRPEPYMGLGVAYERLGEDPDVLINTWAASIRFGTLGERPTLRAALAAIDLGDWPELIHVRGDIVASEPQDPFLIRIDRVLHAAQDLSDVPRSAEDWTRGNVHFRLGDWAEAEGKYQRALHHGDLPGNEVPAVLRNLAVCHENLGHPARAESFRRLAATWTGKKR